MALDYNRPAKGSGDPEGARVQGSAGGRERVSGIGRQIRNPNFEDPSAALGRNENSFTGGNRENRGIAAGNRTSVLPLFSS